MRITRLKINNFRGIKKGELLFDAHVVLVGDNNSGKSTVLEAIDLVLGPERLSRRPIVDEHDFYAGEYKTADGTPVEIIIEVLVIAFFYSGDIVWHRVWLRLVLRVLAISVRRFPVEIFVL